MLKNKLDYIYLLLICSCVQASYFLSFEVTNFKEMAINSNGQIENVDKQITLFEYEDIKYFILSTLQIFILRQIHLKQNKKEVEDLYRPFQYEDFDIKVDRYIHFRFSAFFYGFSILFFQFCYWDHPYVYALVGGQTWDKFAIVKDWPRQNDINPFPYLRQYWSLNMGAHLHNLFNHVICYTYLRNYMEMILHHYMAVMLLFYAYYINQVSLGVIVLICHDIGDFALAFAKWRRELHILVYEQPQDFDKEKTNKIHQDSYYVILVVFWFYGRIYVPMNAYFNASYYLMKDDQFLKDRGDYAKACIIGCKVMLILLMVLWAMNLYWLLLIQKIGFDKLFTGNYLSISEGENLKKIVKPIVKNGKGKEKIE